MHKKNKNIRTSSILLRIIKLKTVKIMKTNQFTFTGLSWLFNSHDNNADALQLIRGLNYLRQFGIDWQIIHDHTGVKLEISGYADILDNRLADDSVTFLIKYRFTESDKSKFATEDMLIADDDRLFIATINEDMVLTVKQLSWDGEIMEMTY